MERRAKRPRVDTSSAEAMANDFCSDFCLPPADLSCGVRFHALPTFEATTQNLVPARLRQISPLTGDWLSSRALRLQETGRYLPAARAASRIRESVWWYPVTVIQGSTGSGKSTQIPQICLEMRNERWLPYGVVAHVSPTIEPLVDLHSRLEEEMDAWHWIHLATGRDKASVAGYTCAMFTTGVLVTAWWDVVQYFSVLIYDESHDRSTSYSELFNMVKPFVDKNKFKLIVMSATLNPSKVYDFFGPSNCNTVNLEGRLYPLYRFEPEVPIVRH